jgi:hypothetical protein
VLPRHHHGVHTIYGKVSKSSTGGTLDFGVMAAEEEEDWIKGFTTNGSDLFLGDFCKCKRGASLKVNVVGKGECCQRGQWGAREEVGIRPIWGGQ